MAKRYVVKLNADERVEFERVVRKGMVAGWKIQRAHAILKCDQGPWGQGWSDERIAEAFGCTTRSLESWRKRAVVQGPLALLERKPRLSPPTPPKLDGEKEARLVALACSDPPEGYARWTLQLLAERLVQLEVVASISDETVRRALKKKRLQTLAQSHVVHSTATKRGVRVPDGASA